MARQKGVRVSRIPIHEDPPEHEHRASDVEETEDDAASVASELSAIKSDQSSEPEDIDESVAEDIERFHESFMGIQDRYRLINRIGEGTFSTVYKAEDLQYHKYRNGWDAKDESPWHRAEKRHKKEDSPRYVAIKKIYVTSSPIRIFNELEILHALRHCKNVCPLITSFRHQDQVIAILPYFQHADFRDYFREMTIADMRVYFKSLFTALLGVHQHGVLHRDIKPTNFLYDPGRDRGVLVDFGLAERQGTDYQPCNCEGDHTDRRANVENSAFGQKTYAELYKNHAYPKPDRDTRPSKRANRAGTRGFRAPEVLLKCTAQTTAIDIWSAGVILLTLLSRRFPFFHSTDDIDALLELTHIFGKFKMRNVALIHGQVFETNIPSYNDNGHSLEKIVMWSTQRSGKDDYGNKLFRMERDEREAVDFLDRCLELDPKKRITAEEALKHEFITKAHEGDADEDLDLL